MHLDAADFHRADIRLDEAEDRLDEGRLAGPVRTDYPDHLVPLDPHRDVEEGRSGIVTDGEVFDLDGILDGLMRLRF